MRGREEGEKSGSAPGTPKKASSLPIVAAANGQ